jgi:hypothetical protein
MSGGSSPIRYFVTGQLKPQPTEVMARNIRPAGVMRARWGAGAEFESVIGEVPAGIRDAYLAPIRPRGHHLSDMPVSRLP